MKLFISIIVCKVLYFVGRLIGKGSSLPGQVALRICPNALALIRLPKVVIAITGSNGKTSTAELVTRSLESDGRSVGWNREGSNQTEGVATLILRISSLAGIVKKDALVLECDERYAKKIFENVKPTALLVTNLCRDQLTRNGHYEFIGNCIRDAINAAGKDIKLVLNADDPYVSALAYAEQLCDGKIRLLREAMWFGVGRDSVIKGKSDNTPLANNYIYDDGAFCPICKSKMTYEYRVAGHYGNYLCNACGFARQKPNFEVVKIDYKSGDISININTSNKSSAVETVLALPSLVGAYNTTSAIAVAQTAGVVAEDSAKALYNYELKGGRTIRFSANGRDGVLLIAKHENSFAYDQSLIWIARQEKACTVVIMVDSISRKYYTSETSWLWDISFDILEGENVKDVVLVGKYITELSMRFALSSVNQKKISYIYEPSDLKTHLRKNTNGEIYAITCFADKAKLIHSLEGDD